jgi:hypothetical protein
MSGNIWKPKRITNRVVSFRGLDTGAETVCISRDKSRLYIPGSASLARINRLLGKAKQDGHLYVFPDKVYLTKKK